MRPGPLVGARALRPATMPAVSLRGHPVEHEATLPDGRRVVVWIGVPDDPYIRQRDLDTVSLELRADGEVLGAVNTVLEPGHVREARAIADEVASGIESGAVPATAGGIERFGESIPTVRDRP